MTGAAGNPGGLRRARDAGLGRWFAAAAVVCFSLGAWLAASRHGPGAGRALFLAVYDGSASVERVRPDHAAWLTADAAREAAEARAAGADFGALLFAGDRAWWIRPGEQDRGAPPPRLGNTLESDLAGALALAHDGARRAGVARGRVRWYSDARTTGESAEAALRALATDGFTALRGRLPPPELPDAELAAIVAPERVEAGAPLACELRVFVHGAREDSGPLSLRLEVQVAGAAGEQAFAFERALELSAGGPPGTLAAPRGVLRCELGPAPAGGARIFARLALAGDPVPENDFASRFVAVDGSLPIAVVAHDPALGALFADDAVRWPGLALFATSPEELPARLLHVRAVLTLDVEPSVLPREALAAFLDAGGGWLDCAGSAALRPAAAGAAGARDLLPLSPDAPPRPARDVLLLVDGSGSMADSGQAAVLAAVPALAAAVPRGDRLLLACFTRELEAPVVVREAGAPDVEAQGLAALLARRASSGGTDIVGALEALAALQAGNEGRALLALLATDGRDPTAGATDASARRAALRARLAAARVELAAFAFGDEPDLAFLAELLPPGRQVHRAVEPGALAALFERAVQDERVRTATAAVASDPSTLGPGSTARELASALAAPARVERAWIAQASSDAEVLWRTAEGEPLLALRAQGAGTSAAFASLPAPAWCPEAALPSALGPLLRALARTDASPGVARRLARADLEDGRLVVRGLPPTVPAAVVAVLPGGSRVVLEPPTALGEDPRTTRSAVLEAEAAARFASPHGTVLQLTTPEGAVLSTVVVPGGREAEFAAAPAFLPEALEVAPESAGAGPSGGRPHPAASWVLGAGVVLLALGLLLGLDSRPGLQGHGRDRGDQARAGDLR